MKNLKFLLAFLCAAVLSSCLDMEEKIVLNADNSGNYSVTIDLGRMLKMAGSMGGEKSEPGKMKEKKDTTVYLKDLVNSSDSLTAAEKALYKEGVIHMNLDEEKNEMKVVISSPFKNAAALTEIKNNFFTVLNKIKAFEKATGEKEKSEEEAGNMDMGTRSANPVGDQFTFMADGSSISNTVKNIEKFKIMVATDSSLGIMTQMTSLMGDFNYRTVIVLPKAVKKYDGPGNSISVDKKTVTFFTTLSEMMEHPEKVSYKVEY